MILSTTAAYGIYPMEASIQGIIANLNEAGCPAEDVCVLMAPSHPVAQAVRDAKFSPMTLNSDAPASELLHWLSRLGAVIIPGVAFFVGSRVFLRAVLAPCPATLSSASTERLLGLGFSQHEADRYADRLNHDGIMIFSVLQWRSPVPMDKRSSSENRGGRSLLLAGSGGARLRRESR
jgi:hypothetical protein